MQKIMPFQLDNQLMTELHTSYLLVGTDIFLQVESLDKLVATAKQQGFTEKQHTVIDAQTDWIALFDYVQSFSLFADKRILILTFPETNINVAHQEKLNQLIPLLHNELLLILIIPKLTKVQENQVWFKTIWQHTILIQCVTPENQQLLQWIDRRCHMLNLNIDPAGKQLLCYYYEGNLLALSQLINTLQLLYKTSHITLPKLESVIHDATQFSVYHWIDALLRGKFLRALHILQQLKMNDTEPLILIRLLQKELILLLNLQIKSKTMSLKMRFDYYKVWQNKRAVYTQVLIRLSLMKLRNLISLLTDTEIRLKRDFIHQESIWQNFETLSMLMCR